MSDSDVPHCLIFDPVPFNGGSKIASFEIIRQSMSKGVRFSVLTCDPSSWRNGDLGDLNLMAFSTPAGLSPITSGWKFWLKQLYFMLRLTLCLLKHRGVNRLVGISGPGVDMALYGYQFLFNRPMIQFIHGPVACSRSVGYCLTRADKTFYLDSSYPSMALALAHYFNNAVADGCGDELARFTIGEPHFYRFANGISTDAWPTSCQYDRPRLFWAASLLKWKGLDRFIGALKQLPKEHKLHSDICYICPHNIALPQSEAPIDIVGVNWHQQPDDLDAIRARCNVFVSTSSNEPFGLSILESLAAGLCVVIPRDNAYWDRKLTHNINCIKYTPENSTSLSKAIEALSNSPQAIRRIGEAGQHMAQRYQAQSCYQHMVATLIDPQINAALSQSGQQYA